MNESESVHETLRLYLVSNVGNKINASGLCDKMISELLMIERLKKRISDTAWDKLCTNK